MIDSECIKKNLVSSLILIEGVSCIFLNRLVLICRHMCDAVSCFISDLYKAYDVSQDAVKSAVSCLSILAESPHVTVQSVDITTDILKVTVSRNIN